MCGTGNLQACEVMYAFEMARSGAVGGSQVSGGGGSAAGSTMPHDHTISASPDNGDFGSCNHPEIDDQRTLSSLAKRRAVAPSI